MLGYYPFNYFNFIANREGLAGQVQMIYVDPPYGINFRSNFQPDVFDTSGRDGDQHISREIEQIKAYRDTWKRGVHSYLSYLRQRFVISRELLKDSGSIFVQISDENVHRVRCLLDEVFGHGNFVGEIVFKTRSTSTSKYLSVLNDFILWYAKDLEKLKFNRLYFEKELNKTFSRAEKSNGEIVSAFSGGKLRDDLLQKTKYFSSVSLSSTSGGASTNQPFLFCDREFRPTTGRGWRCSLVGLGRLAKANRIIPQSTTIRYKFYYSDFAYSELRNLWTEQLSESNKTYVVQTSPKVVERCILMSTDPGDLVIDPTCGGGTTAYVAEKWGRRWITIDTSRIAITLARTRLLTATFDYYKVNDTSEGIRSGFVLKTAPHIQLRDIANNVALDSIFARYEPILVEKLTELNIALQEVTPEIRQELRRKLAANNRNITDADRRRWDLPETAWKEWEVPFDTDPDWPELLQGALATYRHAWQEYMDEVNTCINESAKQVDLVDQPEIKRNLLRVSGPFTVESLQPPAVSLDEAATPIGLDVEPSNGAAYIEQMFSLLKTSGVDFDNQRRQFTRLDRLDGDFFHAEGHFEDDGQEIGVVFGPQHGPVTAWQVENCLREARRIYDVLLFAGFHFEPEAQAIIQDEHRRLQTHLVQISPDVAMDDLLRRTHTDKLFTVIGAPRIVVRNMDDGQHKVIMEGVDTYNPADNTIEPTRADQVAAWFLDANYDNRTFCPTQSFFPNRSAWRNIVRSLRSVIDEDNLEAFSGTESLPFPAGEHNRIAVKVIDRRGNELMRIHKLGERDGQ